MATQQNIMSDLGTLSKVPTKVISALAAKANLCIGSAIHDALLAGEDAIQLNIGIGALCVSLSDMQCKFIPSKDLKAIIKRSVSEKIDPLEFELEQALIAKLTEACSEEL